MAFKTNIEGFMIREGKRKDIPLILRFIRELADYEGLLHEVKATEDILEQSIFEEEGAHVFIAEENEKPVGFALYFYNFSTFEGRAGLYLEDLYIAPEYRGKGYGKKMLQCLAHQAVEKNCKRFEWWCLDENKPSYDFYKAIGAEDMVDWTVFRVDGERLQTMSEEFKES